MTLLERVGINCIFSVEILSQCLNSLLLLLLCILLVFLAMSHFKFSCSLIDNEFLRTVSFPLTVPENDEASLSVHVALRSPRRYRRRCPMGMSVENYEFRQSIQKLHSSEHIYVEWKESPENKKRLKMYLKNQAQWFYLIELGNFQSIRKKISQLELLAKVTVRTIYSLGKIYLQ